MYRRRLPIFASILLLLFLPSLLWAGEATVFGPKDFKINWFRFHFSIKSFKVPLPGEGNIIITRNFEKKEIKRGFVLLNGKYISLTKFLSSKDAVLEKDVRLRSRNFLLVFLRGKKGASISIEVRSRESQDPPAVEFSADPNAITIGESSTLSWHTEDADKVTIDQGIGEVELNGTYVVTPQQTTMYTLTAEGPGGTTTRSVVVDVFIPVPSVEFTATPTTITRGESFELNWSTEYAQTVTISPGIGQVDVSGSLTLFPIQTTTYTLTAIGEGGTSSNEAIITVIQPPPTVTLSADPDDILLGENATLSWSSTFADSVNIEPDVGDVAPSGSITVSPTETTTYTATATGLGGSAVDEVVITVTDPNAPPTVEFTEEQCDMQQNDSCILSWTSTKATGAFIDNGVGSVSPNGSVTVTPDYTTLYTVSVSGETGSAKAQILVKVLGSVEPMDNESFGKQYEDLIPVDAVLESYDENRFSLVRGQVLDVENNAVAGVLMNVHGMPEYGTTLSDENGYFTMPVEGGTTITLNFWKKGYIEAQRKVYVPWNDIAIVNGFQMLQEDPKQTVFTFDGSSDTIGIHESSMVSDEFGDRSITLVFTGDNRAFMVDENGNDVRELQRITTRASEFTTPESMPAELPPQTGYTYCVELTIDGIPRIRFENPVTAWVDNFLEFDVGEIVPVGTYDRKLAEWVPEDNGLVVKLLDLDSDGVVDALDGDGDDLPDDLNGDGSFADEVEGLGNPDRYQPGDTFWRFAVTHFTPWDCNWPYGPPEDAVKPEEDPRDDEQEPDQCELPGASYIEERNRILHEDIEIPGTQLKLHYASNRTDSYKYVITIPISGETIPDNVLSMVVNVNIAGKVYSHELNPAPNQVVKIVWDGRDYRGNTPRYTNARISMGYRYRAVYYSSRSSWRRSFSRVGAYVTGIASRRSVTLWKRKSMYISLPHKVLSGELSYGKGWTLSDQHAYDNQLKVLHKGDGEIVKNDNARIHYRFRAIDTVTSTFAGTGIRGYSGDGGPALDANLNYPNKIITNASDKIYLSTQNRIRSIDKGGIINTFAGNGYYGYSGDGGPAVEATISDVQDMAFDRAGNLYFADSGNWVIRKIDTQGIITTVAGIGYFEESPGKNCTCTDATCDYGTCSGEPPSLAGYLNADPPVCGCDPFQCTGCNEIEGLFCEFCGCEGIEEFRCVVNDCVCEDDPNAGNGDGSLASSAKINRPRGVAVDSWGNIYISETGSHKIRKVGADGIIETLAGSNIAGFSGDGGQASDALLNGPADLELDRDGNLYILDRYNYRVRKIDQAGIITTIAGNGTYGIGSVNVPAVESALYDARDIFLDGNGNLYIVERTRIRRVDSKGIITWVTGKTYTGYQGDGYPSNYAVYNYPTGVTVNKDNNLLIVDRNNQRVRIITDNTPYVKLQGIYGRVFVDESGKAYQIQDGKHVKTMDADTAVTLQTLNYENELLTSLVDRFNRTITIERNVQGTPLSITSPYGQKTQLQIDENGLLQGVLLPDGSLYAFEYTPGGLLTEKVDPEGNSFSYLFNSDGRVAEVNNEQGGKWSFFKDSTNKDFDVTEVLSAEGNLTAYQDFKEPWGVSLFQITDPTGTQRFVSENQEGTEITSTDVCDIDDSYSYSIDPQYKIKKIISRTRTTPSGLVKSYQMDRDYSNSSIVDWVSVNNKTTQSTLDFLNSIQVLRSPMGREIRHHLDLTTLLRQKTELPGVHDIIYNHDSDGRLLSRVTGTRSDQFAYNSSGFLESVTEPNFIVTAYAYDQMGRVIGVTRPKGSELSFQYDKNGNMTVFVNSKSVEHRFGYNKTQARNLYQAPLSGSYTYQYDRDGRPIQTTYPSGRFISNTYNQGVLKEVSTPEGMIVLDYHCGNKLKSINKGNNTITLDYDGSLVTADNRSGELNQSLSYTYNNDFDISTFSYAGSTVNYSYDNDGLLTQSGDFNIGRNHQSGLIESVGDGTFLLNQSNNLYGERAGENYAVGGTAIANWSTEHNGNGKIVGKTETNGGQTVLYNYTYDTLGQLLTVSRDGTIVEEYRYDPSGLRNFERNDLRGITGRSFSYSDEDQVLSAGSIVYQYSVDGYLSRKTDGPADTNYTYSSRGELLSVNLPDGRLVEYTHDPYGSRLSKKINGTVVEKYLWEDEIKLLAVFDGADNVKMRFAYAGDRVPVGMVKGGQVYYLTYDNVRTLRSVADVNGSEVKRIDYDAFGSIVNDSNPGFTLPFGFAGGLHDRDTGLVRFGARDYDPDTGRWTAKDPIGIHGEETDLYGYVLNDPVNFVDPTGEILHVPAWAVWVMLVAAIGGEVVVMGEHLNPPPIDEPYADEPLEEQRKFPMKCKPAHAQPPKNGPIRQKNKNINKRRTPYKKLQRGRRARR